MKLYKQKSGWGIVLFLTGVVGMWCFAGCRQEVPDSGIRVYEGTQWSVVWEGDKVGVINAQTGEVIVPVEYDEYDYEDRYLRLFREGEFHHSFIYRNHRKLVCMGEGDLWPFGADKWMLKKDGTVFFSDTLGVLTGPSGYYTDVDYAYEIKGDYYYAYRGKRCRVMDGNFNKLPGRCSDYIPEEEESEPEEILFETFYQDFPGGQGQGGRNMVTGREVIPPQPGQWVSYYDPVVVVSPDTENYNDRGYYLYDIEGNLITETVFDRCDSYSKQYLLLKKDGRNHIFDRATNDWLALPYKIHYENLPSPLMVVSQEGKYGLYHLDKDSLVTPCIYDGYRVRNSDYIMQLAGKEGVWDRRGNQLLPVEYDEIVSTAPYILKNEGLYGMMSYKGAEFIAPQFKEVGIVDSYDTSSSTILYAISDEGLRYFDFYWENIYELDVCTYKGKQYPTWSRYKVFPEGKGEVLYDCETQEILFTLQEGQIIYVNKEGRMIRISRPDESEDFLEVPTGRTLIPEGYCWERGIFHFSYVYLTSGDEKYGVYDVEEGKWVLPPVYTGISPAQWGAWTVSNEEGKWGIRASGDSLLVPMIYDRIEILY